LAMNFWRQIAQPIIGLSPMDGVTDAPFRFITAKHGAPDVMFTEFVNIQSAFYSPATLIKDLDYSELERPIVAQIYGRAPELFYKVAHIVGELGFDGLDINMGCPSRKVAALGCGAALIRAPELAREIIRGARRGIEDWAAGQSLADIGIEASVIEKVKRANCRRTGSARPKRCLIPVSVKTRLGYERNIVQEWIPVLLEEKPAAISLHGRTLQQGYKGLADWDAIARAAEIAAGSETLIIGNGDVQDLADAWRRARATRVHGVLLGRAAQGNPWVFAGKERIKTTRVDVQPTDLAALPPALAERFRVIVEHCERYEKHMVNCNFAAMRKHLSWYCKNFRGAAELRSQMMRVNSASEVVAYLDQFLSQREGAGPAFSGCPRRTEEFAGVQASQASPVPCA
jgi:tRNA-dihydrouridine synthase